MSLTDHPGLERWLHGHRKVSTATLDPGERLLLNTCETLAAGPQRGLRSWVDALKRFAKESDSPLNDFVRAETIAQECNADLLQIVSGFGEQAVRGDLAEPFQKAVQAAADATGLIALRFLAAWSALNHGDLETCLDECEKVDQPYASIYTIQGQAYIELRRPREAIPVLATAVKLAPQEILAWFQLAKAHHLLDDTDAAWRAILECQRLAPQNPEISLFTAMIALGKGSDAAMHRRAYQELRPHLRLFSGNADVLFSLLRLCIAAEAHADCAGVLADGNWDALKIDRSLLNHLPDTLRSLNERAWHDVAKDLLTRLTQPASAAG